MKLEKLITALNNTVRKGVPSDSEIVEISTIKTDKNVESITIFTEKGNHIYEIHTSWQNVKDEIYG